MKCKKTHFIRSGNENDRKTEMTFNASKPDFVLFCEKQQVGAMEGSLDSINTFKIFEEFRDKKHSIIFLELLEEKAKKAGLKQIITTSVSPDKMNSALKNRGFKLGKDNQHYKIL